MGTNADPTGTMAGTIPAIHPARRMPTASSSSRAPWGTIALPPLARLDIREQVLTTIALEHRPAFQTKREWAAERPVLGCGRHESMDD